MNDGIGEAVLPSLLAPDMELKTLVAKLKVLTSAPHFKMTPIGTQQQVNIAAGMVEALLADTPPTQKQTAKSSNMSRMVLKQAAWFCQPKGGDGTSQLTGAQAYKELLQQTFL